MSRARPERGDVWKVDLDLELEDGVTGHEQGGERPALIVSTNSFNFGPSQLLIIVPVTSTQRNWKYQINVRPPDGGLRNPSVLLCEQVRCITTDRLIRYMGIMPKAIMEDVGDALFDLLDLQSD